MTASQKPGTPASVPGLPGWDQMSDLDKGAALLHLHKRDREGDGYAEENYPARYFDHPALLALTPLEASRHAASFGTAEDMYNTLGDVEFDRLYDAALDADRRRPDPPIFAASVAARTSAKSAASASILPADTGQELAPVHEYQVTHRISLPGEQGGSSMYTSAWHMLEEALDILRNHKF